MKVNMKKTLIETLGIQLIEVTKEKTVATMPVDDRTRQPFGFLHGGASVALAETVASVGAFSLIDQETEACVGLEINANHLKAVKDGTVTATGVPLHRGKTTMVWEIKIVNNNNELICVSRCTMAIIQLKK